VSPTVPPTVTAVVPPTEPTVDDLKDVLTVREPLGPSATEDILSHRDVFLELYETKANLNHALNPGRPAYVIGRKGSGKTAFLIGEGLHSDSDVVSVRAENAFAVMDNLKVKWEASRGAIPVDNLVYLWETILVHAAMRGASNLGHPMDAPYLSQLKEYLAGFRPRDPDPSSTQPAAVTEDQFLAAVAQHVWDSLDTSEGIASIRDVVAKTSNPAMSYSDARTIFFSMLGQHDRQRRLCVVVDNLEDLHQQVEGLEQVLAGLFRLVSRVTDPTEPISLPFDLRFAFPAELMSRLRAITANPEKDFRNRIVIHWKAYELIDLAGLRLKTSLQVHFPQDARAEAATKGRDDSVLRAVLPEGDILNGLGSLEDPVAYIMRHTQLLPRHLIQILNSVLSPAFSGNTFRRATRDELIRGVRDAERTIVEGILSSYSYHYPQLGMILDHLQNKIPMYATMDDLRRIYNLAGAKRVSNERFDEFVWAAMSAGVLGIHRDSTRRYNIADFSYTFDKSLRPRDDAVLCLHPLFVHHVYDDRELMTLRTDGTLPTYPFGSAIEDEYETSS
jgi:hypothetical protein